jgi:dipeptidyl aminopeptidase/acylaminoacyl peptidase
MVLTGVLAAALAGTWVGGWAQGVSGSHDGGAGKRPMTFVDLQRMKRVSDPQISPSGRWVMFSVTDVDLEKNSKVNHLWVVPMGGPGTGGSSARGSSGRERQVTFWKEGESGGRFSPDGRQVLFVSQDGGTSSQIFLAPWNEATGTLGTPKQLTNVSTEADGAVWSPDSQRILFVSRVYPECSEGSSWLEEDNCDQRKDADDAANPVKAQVWDHLLYRHWNSYVGPKRSHVLVVSATDGNAVRDLTPRQDIGDAEAPTFSLGGPMGYAWAPDSKEIAYVTNLDLVPAASTNNDVFTLRLDTPGAKPLKVSMSLGSDDGPAYSPDGKWLAFRSQARSGYESDRFRLMLLDRETMKSAGLLPKFDRWVDEFAWAPDSKAIYLASGDFGEEPIYHLRLDGKVFEQVTETGEYGSLSLSSDGTRLVATRMKVDEPAEVFALSMDKPGTIVDKIEIKPTAGEPTLPPAGGSSYQYLRQSQLTDLNGPLVKGLNLPEMESFWFTGAVNTKVQGFIVRPPNFDETKKYPVKFLIHGGPQGAWGDAWSYRWNAELMAASGYVVVMVNPRGSTGYGQAFIDGVNGDWGGKAYVDLMKGMDYAEKQYPFIDKTRECALGGSYGGFMANWILTHTDRFACIVTHDGMFNPQSAYGDTEELWFNEWEFREPVSTTAVNGRAARPASAYERAQPWNYFDRPAAEDPFRKWSPMLAIRNAKTPTLVIHSQRDYRLDVSEGFQLFTALKRLNVPSRMLYFPDEGHWVLKPQNSKLWYETVGDWCDRWTKTNAYSVGGYESAAMPAEEPTVAAPATRVGQSRPAEMDDARPATPASAVSERTPEKISEKAAEKTPEKAAAPITHAAPVQHAAPITPVPPLTHAATVTPAAPVQAPATARVVNPPRAGDNSGSFSITISAPEDEVQVGSDARVNITLTNTAGHQMLFGHHPGANNPEFSFRIEVRSAAGHAVEETAYGREALQHQQAESRTVDYLQPGQTVVQTAHIEKLVDLKRPGRYTVQVSRKDPEKGVVVRSNEVVLNVVP